MHNCQSLPLGYQPAPNSFFFVFSTIIAYTYTTPGIGQWFMLRAINVDIKFMD
ncbi:MAG: hypothetical protein WCQ70_00725 [Lentimicrobiaceae bacterium]